MYFDELGLPEVVSEGEVGGPADGNMAGREGAAALDVPDPPEPVRVPKGGRGPRVRGVARPEAPTLHERREHQMTAHAVYAPWCEYCVRSRAIEDLHWKEKPDTVEMGGGTMRNS